MNSYNFYSNIRNQEIEDNLRKFCDMIAELMIRSVGKDNQPQNEIDL